MPALRSSRSQVHPQGCRFRQEDLGLPALSRRRQGRRRRHRASGRAGCQREGYPEAAEAFKRYAFEEAAHASKFAELLGEVVTNSTKKNLELRTDAEQGACAAKLEIAKRAKELGYDAIHDTVHEMAKDEARHGAGFEGLLKRYFK